MPRVIAGDIDMKTAREKVQKYFGISRRSPVAHQTEWVAKMTGVTASRRKDACR